MKILVPIKRVADPENANKVIAVDNGARVSSEGLEWKMNPYDEYALEAALRLNENGSTKAVLGETVVVSVGPNEATSTLRQAMAMGADRGVLVAGEDDQLDSYAVANLLSAIALKETPDLILLGKIAADTDSNAVGQYLAEKLGWPMATLAMRIQTADDGKNFVIVREVDTGALTLQVQGPLVITVSDRIIHPEAITNGVTPNDFRYPESEGGRYASLKGIMAAKKKPIVEFTAAALGISADKKTRYTHFAPAQKRSGTTAFVGSVDELIEKLHKEAKVL